MGSIEKRMSGASLRLGVALAVLCLAPLLAGAEDWPQFHGDQALSGKSAGALPEKPRLAWTFKTGGPVKSSAAISQGRVFIGSEDGLLYALSLADGRKLWSFNTHGAVNSSPLVLHGKVFVGSEYDSLCALDAESGTLLWEYATGDKIVGGVNWAASGERTNLLLGCFDSKLHCVDMITGKTNWCFDAGNYVNGTPAVSNGKVIFGGCDGTLHVLDITSGKQEQDVDAGSYIPGSAAISGDLAFFGCYGNQVFCVNFKTGEKVWTFKDRHSPYHSSPAVGIDRILIGGQDKLVHCLRRSDGVELWNFATKGLVDSSPVICGDKVVCASDDGRIYFLSLDHGKQLWSYDAGQDFKSSPAVADGRIVIGCDDGQVYCFSK